MGSRERSSWFMFEIKRVPQMHSIRRKTLMAHNMKIVIKDIALAYNDCELDNEKLVLDC